MSKIFPTLFNKFRAAPFFRPPFEGLWEICDLFTRSKLYTAIFWGFNCKTRLHWIAASGAQLVQILGGEFIFCSNDTVAVALRFAMKMAKLLLIAEIPCDFVCDSKMIFKIASDCGCDAVVHLGSDTVCPICDAPKSSEATCAVLPKQNFWCSRPSGVGLPLDYHYTQNDYRTELLLFSNFFCSANTEPNCFWNNLVSVRSVSRDCRIPYRHCFGNYVR